MVNRNVGSFALSHAIRTDSGGRRVNEDSAIAHVSARGFGCFIVADGLGGHGGGDIASKCAVDAILRSVDQNPRLDSHALEAHIDRAHDEICRMQSEAGQPGMRTTVTVLLIHGTKALWAHVGDSRLYLIRHDKVVHQTRDHSVPQMLVDAGELALSDIRRHDDRNRILRALGHDEAPRATVVSAAHELYPGDVFLLCTDGWWEYVTEGEMIVDQHKARDVDEWLDHMIRRIRGRAEADHDNFTAVSVAVQG